jgi:protein-S-isoprenylcysteine O-methyltransferase Ste14
MMADARPSHPGVHVPSPFLFVAGFLVALALERWVFSLRFGAGSRPTTLLTGWLLLAVGASLVLWAVRTFTRARTTLMPFKPASSLVTGGPFRFSRNPMYVGSTLIYIGLSLLLRMVWPLVLLPLVLTMLFALVVRREERYLAAAFEAEYAEYRRRVRRWL